MATSLIIKDILREAQIGLGTTESLLESQLLLAHVLDRPRTWLIAHDDETLSETQHHCFVDLIKQRRQGTPIAYLLGEQEFWSMALKVTPATLIPRPDTECLVEAILELPRTGHPTEPRTILDLGTGSGAIALALAKELVEDFVIGVDQSSAAIAVAWENKVRHQIENAQFYTGSWTSAVAGQKVDILVSNPPYVREDDEHLEALRFEPKSALTSGADGLRDIRLICAEAKRCLKPGGTLAVEHGFDQQSSVMEIFSANNLVNVQGFSDLNGQPRFVMAKAP